MHRKFIVGRHWELQGLIYPLYVWKKIWGQQWDAQSVVKLLLDSKTRDCPVGPRALAESIVELGNEEMKMDPRWIVLKLCHGGWGIGRN